MPLFPSLFFHMVRDFTLQGRLGVLNSACDHMGKLPSGVKISGSPIMTSSQVLSSGSALSLKKC